MRKLLFFFMLFAASVGANAQTQTYATVTASNLTDGAGSPVVSGRLCFAPTDNSGNPIAVHTVGQMVSKPVCAAVQNGSVASLTLANTQASTPNNFCWAATLTDNTHAGAGLLPKTGYNCVQMNSTWCSASGGTYNCNWDNYVPSSPAQVAVIAPNISVGTVNTLAPGSSATASISGTTPNFALNLGLPAGNTGNQGIQGNQGTPGQAAQYIGAWSSSTAYSIGAVVSYSGANYVALAANTNVTPVVGATWGAYAGVAGSVALAPSGDQIVAEPSTSTGFNQSKVNVQTVTQDFRSLGAMDTPQRIPKKLLSQLEKSYHQVVRMQCLGTSIESFPDSVCVNFVKSLQAAYGKASTRYLRAFSDQAIDGLYTTGCAVQQGYQGALFARTTCGNSAIVTHFTSAERTTIVYDQESAGGTAAVPVYIDGQVTLANVTPGTGGTVNGSSSGSLTCSPSGGTAIVPLTCSAYMSSGGTYISINNGGVYTSISGLSFTLSGTSYVASTGASVTPALNIPAYQPNAVQISSQLFGSGYSATAPPYCAISGGTTSAPNTSASCKAYVNPSGQVVASMYSNGSYASGSATPTLAVSGAGSGSGFSATLALANGVTFYNANGSNYRQTFDIVGLQAGVPHRITLVFPASGASGYIEGWEDGSASGYADKGVELMWNSRPSSKLDDFFNSCYPVGTCVTASPQAFAYGTTGGYVTGGYASTLWAGSHVDPDFYLFGGPTNDATGNNANFTSELNTFVGYAAAHNVPGILLIEPTNCGTGLGTLYYGSTSGCGSGTNNGTSVWATQKAAMLAACNANPDLLYCADEDDWVAFESANPNFHVSPLANSGDPHTYEFFMGNERIGFAEYLAQQFGLPHSNSGANEQNAITDVVNTYVPPSIIYSSTEPCASIGTFWEDTSNTAGVVSAASTLKQKIGTTGFSFDLANGVNFPSVNQKNTGCSRGVWAVISGVSKNAARPVSDPTVVANNSTVSIGHYSNGDAFANIAPSSAYNFSYSMALTDVANIVPGGTYTFSAMIRAASLPASGATTFYCYMSTNVSTIYSYLNTLDGQFENTSVTAKNYLYYVGGFQPLASTSAQPDYDTDYHSFAVTFQLPSYPDNANLSVTCSVPSGAVVEFSHPRLDYGASIAINTKEPQQQASGDNMVVNLPASTTEPLANASYQNMTWNDTSSTFASIAKQNVANGVVYRLDTPGLLSKGSIWKITSGTDPDTFNLQSSQTCTSFSLGSTITNTYTAYPQANSPGASGCQDVLTANTGNTGYILSTFTPSGGVNFTASDNLTLSWLYQSYPTAGNTNPSYSKPTAAIIAYNSSTAYYLQANMTWSTTAYTGWALPFVYATDTSYRRVAISFPSPGAFTATQFAVRIYPNAAQGSATVAYTIFLGDFRLEHGSSVTEQTQRINFASTSALPLSGTTAAWNNGGSAIAANSCVSGPTATIAGVATTMSLVVTPAANPGSGLTWSNAYISSGTTVQVQVCNTTAAGVTPTSTTYNIRAIQ